VRAVVDANVIISGLLSPHGAPARVVAAWLDGGYDLVVSPLLLQELERALGYPKLRKRVTGAETQELLNLLRREADHHDDPPGPPPVSSRGPGDDYLISLAAATQSVIVSGDRHLFDLRDELPVYTPAEFLSLIDESPGFA
jgi:putative PIN family toxin of toxin-antitoxin system